MQDPSTTWIDLKATLAEDVEILPGTQIKGATAIERGATIGPDTTLVDCEIGEDAVVKRTDATLAVIGAGASVGPFAYLRPGSYLGADGKIGTFVEVKNSRIGDGTKVPHLSYIGDAEVGEQLERRRRHDHRQLRRGQQAQDGRRVARAHRRAQRVRRSR